MQTTNLNRMQNHLQNRLHYDRNPEIEDNPPPPYREESPPPYSVPKRYWTTFRIGQTRDDLEIANPPSASGPRGDDADTSDTTPSPFQTRRRRLAKWANDHGMGRESECWCNICTNLVL